LNSEINKEKEKKKKKKKSKEKKGDITGKTHKGIKKNDIFSKLDTIDVIRKRESLIVEESLRVGIIKSEQAEKEENIEREKLTVIEIKKQINNLQKIKNKHHSEGNYEKAIEISKEIIVLAFSNNLKSLVNEENNFLDIIREKIIQEPKKLNIHKEDEGVGVLEALNDNVIVELKETEIQEKAQFEDEKRKFKMIKQEFEQEKLKFKEEKDRFEQEKLQFEEKGDKLEQERTRFEEEKEAFNWEKQMFEEVKKHEKEKINDLKKT